jgi:hypothetical protein
MPKIGRSLNQTETKLNMKKKLDFDIDQIQESINA